MFYLFISTAVGTHSLNSDGVSLNKQYLTGEMKFLNSEKENLIFLIYILLISNYVVNESMTTMLNCNLVINTFNYLHLNGSLPQLLFAGSMANDRMQVLREVSAIFSLWYNFCLKRSHKFVFHMWKFAFEIFGESKHSHNSQLLNKIHDHYLL